jgi:hypothetical protein
MEIPSETGPWTLIKFHSPTKCTIPNNTAQQQAYGAGCFRNGFYFNLQMDRI